MTIQTTCCIAGGGPAGMMLGYLLARAGIDTTVLEKHADFLRDFRGDTIHPSTLQLMDELGLLDEFLTLPHAKAEHISATIGTETFRLADFTHLPGRAKFIAFMPQWDFLNFLARHAQALPNFHLLMSTSADTLTQHDDQVTGITAHGPDGPIEIQAALTIAADGRTSTLRPAAGFRAMDIGAPMDVLWFRLSRRPEDQAETFGRVDGGRFLILINRDTHWQCGYIIAKGTLDTLKSRGLEAFQADLAALQPSIADRVHELASWDDVKLLTVAVNRLEQWWKPGFLCIGDAAHAMSPVGGVGVNLAIQDAVAAANRLVEPLRRGRVTGVDLAAVQARRMFPTRATQRLQVAIQNRVVRPALAATGPTVAPWPLRLMAHTPLLQRIPARIIGLGVRPEHISPALLAQS